MDLLDAVKNRRSVREFTSEDVDMSSVNVVLEAGRWAPSGLNNQPWRFIVVRDADLRNKLAGQTKYGTIINDAPVNIAVFMDHGVCYDLTKDVLSMGACVQNMLLAAHSLGLGGVWLGEILKNRDSVRELLDAPESWELMAVVALGHPTKKDRGSDRRSLGEIVKVK